MLHITKLFTLEIRDPRAQEILVAHLPELNRKLKPLLESLDPVRSVHQLKLHTQTSTAHRITRNELKLHTQTSTLIESLEMN